MNNIIWNSLGSFVKLFVCYKGMTFWKYFQVASLEFRTVKTACLSVLILWTIIAVATIPVWMSHNLEVFNSVVNDQSFIFTFGQSRRPKTENYLAKGQIPKPNIEIFLNFYLSVLFAVLISLLILILPIHFHLSISNPLRIKKVIIKVSHDFIENGLAYVESIFFQA